MKLPVQCPHPCHATPAPDITSPRYDRDSRCPMCRRLVGDLPGTLWLELVPEALGPAAALTVLYWPTPADPVERLFHGSLSPSNDGATP